MFCPYIPGGALTPYAAESAGWPWPDVCRAVLDENLPAYVASSDGKTWRAAPEQFAGLLTEDPFKLEFAFWFTGNHTVRTTDGDTIVGQIFFFKNDLKKVFETRNKKSQRRTQPKRRMAKKLLRDMHPSGLPSKEELPDHELFKKCSSPAWNGISQDTISRAAADLREKKPSP